jgi:hypothetical protein
MIGIVLPEIASKFKIDSGIDLTTIAAGASV